MGVEVVAREEIAKTAKKCAKICAANTACKASTCNAFEFTKGKCLRYKVGVQATKPRA